MNVNMVNEFVHVQATSKNGISDAYLLGSDELKTDTTSQFFTPATNWLRRRQRELQEVSEPLAFHRHFRQAQSVSFCHYHQHTHQQKLHRTNHLPYHSA